MIAALVFMFCTLMAAELIFVVYAGWIEADFGATTEQLALVFGLLGFVELVGSSGSTLLVDRLGKRRTVLIAFSAVAIFQALLPISAGNWGLFLLLFLLFDLWFEFAIVSVFPLVSGILSTLAAPCSRWGSRRSGWGAWSARGSARGSGQQFGFIANGLLAATMTALGVIICLLFVREGEN